MRITNVVLSFCFVTMLFNHKIQIKKQTSLELKFFTNMLVVNSLSRCSKMEYKIIASHDKLLSSTSNHLNKDFILKF